MPPTPATVNGVLRIEYSVNAFVHKHDSWCDIDGTGTGAQINSFFSLPVLIDPADAAARMWTRISFFYNTGVVNPAWTLFRYTSGTLIPQTSGTLTQDGQSANGSVLADQLSLTFATISNRRFNDYWFETVLTPPGKSIVNSTPSDLQDYIDAYLSPTDAIDMGAWVRNKGGDAVGRFLRWTNGLNDKLQRLRSLK